MFNPKFLPVAIATLFLGATAQASTVVYSDEAAFLAASGGALSFESFENVTQPSATSVSFGGGTFSCSGSAYCPGFFGVSTAGADTGIQSIYFASPDTAIFTFASAITAFGLHIGGAGDVAVNTLTATFGNGDTGVALNNYSGTFSIFGDNNQYFGAVSSTAFTTVAFHASNANDGIFFDSMRFGVAAAVPEPETYALMLAGLGLVGAIARRRKAHQV